MASLFKAIKKVGRFAKSGFLGHNGKVAYLSEEVLQAAIDKAVGLPVLLEHNDDGKVYGYVSKVYREGDWYLAEMIIHDENMAKVLEQEDNGGFKTSTGFYIKSGREGNFLRNDVPYQLDIGSIDWKEWTLTRNPKYQDAVILNSAEDKKEVNFCEDFINEQAEETPACEEDKTEEVTNNSEKETKMSKVTIQGKEFDESYVANAIADFEKGSNSIVATLKSVFSKSNQEVLNESQEEEKPAEEEVKNEEVKDEQTNSESESSDEEVSNSQEEEEAKTEEKADEEVSDDEVKNKSDEEVQNESEEDKKVETKTSEEVKNSMTAPVSAKQIDFDFANKKY